MLAIAQAICKTTNVMTNINFKLHKCVCVCVGGGGEGGGG